MAVGQGVMDDGKIVSGSMIVKVGQKVVYKKWGGSATATHTYETAGSYQVSALMTDDLGGVSDQANCTQTITVNDLTPTASASPTLEPTGPGSAFLGIGAVVGILTVIGGLLFFAL